MAVTFRVTICVCALWLIASSLYTYPHSLSFFNESIGGPLNGAGHLLGSNLDWGQDLSYAIHWKRTQTDRLFVASGYFADPHSFGLMAEAPDPLKLFLFRHDYVPGRYLIGVNLLNGHAGLGPTIAGDERVAYAPDAFCDFQFCKPVANVGYTFKVFDLRAVRSSEADAVQKLSLEVSPQVFEAIRRIRRLARAPVQDWLAMHALLTLTRDEEAAGRMSPVRAEFVARVLSQDASTSPFRVVGRSVEPKAQRLRFDGERHPQQYLAYLATAQVPLSEPLRVGNQLFSIRDLFNASKLSVSDYGELAWTACACSSYLENEDDCWTNKFGEIWSLERITVALNRSPERACGGAHRLLGLASLVRNHSMTQNETLRRALLAAALTLHSESQFLAEHTRPDGVIELNWNDEPPAAVVPLDNRDIVYVNGHSLEWLAVSYPNIEGDVEYLSTIADKLAAACIKEAGDLEPMTMNPTIDWRWRFGNLCHACSGLENYRLLLAHLAAGWKRRT